MFFIGNDVDVLGGVATLALLVHHVLAPFVDVNQLSTFDATTAHLLSRIIRRLRDHFSTGGTLLIVCGTAVLAGR